MDVVVIGVSSIFRRRVMPALLSLSEVEKIHLASRQESIDIDIPDARRGQFVQGYEAALNNIKPCLAYISLPNHLHAEWTLKALSAGFHVVIDKPACLNWDDAQSLLELAKRKNLCLAEATVWPFHPQVAVAKQIFQECNELPSSIQATFSFPPLDPNNFRNQPTMGGGSFYDLGLYAVTPGRVFFEAKPLSIRTEILHRNPVTGIDTGFAISAMYPEGRIFQGYFSFTTEYKNTLSLLGPSCSVGLEPVFTTTNSSQSEIQFRAMGKSEVIRLDPADSFANFFRAVITSIQASDWQTWLDIFGHDAHAMYRAAEAAGVEKS